MLFLFRIPYPRIKSRNFDKNFIFLLTISIYPDIMVTVTQARAYPGVAQFGSALEWGSRGREFDSRHSDQGRVLMGFSLFFFITASSSLRCFYLLLFAKCCILYRFVFCKGDFQWLFLNMMKCIESF